jgi:ankyrin repeat protein
MLVCDLNLKSAVSARTLLTACLLVVPAWPNQVHQARGPWSHASTGCLLAQAPDLTSLPSEREETPLHTAVRNGDIEAIKSLLRQGASVNALAYNDLTPLHLVSDVRAARLLIEYGADVNALDAFGKSPLYHAASSGRRDLSKALLDAGAYYDIESAICLDDPHRVRALLVKNPGPARDKDKALLHLAASRGGPSIVRLLLQYRADPQALDSTGLPPIYFAIEHPAIVKILLDANAKANICINYQGNGAGPPRNSTPLHVAAERGQVESARLLLAHGASVDARTDTGWTPLHDAAAEGRNGMIKLLLDNKADPQARTYTGWTPMALAAEGVRPNTSRRSDTARYRAVIETLHNVSGVSIDLFAAMALGDPRRVGELLKSDARLANTKNAAGKPALHRAIELNLVDVVPMFLDSGCGVNTANEAGRTALHETAFWGSERIAKLLVEHHASVNCADKSGATPLHEAARMRHTTIARLLLAAGAAVNAKDKRGRTPLSWADDYGKSSELCNLLREHGGLP